MMVSALDWYSPRKLSNISETLTFLFTPRNRLFTVFDVSRDDSGMLKLHQEPYPILGPALDEMSAYIFFHRTSNRQDELMLIGLSEAGELLGRSLLGPTTSRDWPEEVHSMYSTSRSLKEDGGALSARDQVKTDFSEVYEGEGWTYRVHSSYLLRSFVCDPQSYSSTRGRKT